MAFLAPYRLYITIAGFAVAFIAGWTVHSWKVGAGETKAAVEVVEEVGDQGEITGKVGGDLTKKKNETQQTVITIIKKVPVYVTREADRNCPVPVGFVSLFNHAAENTVPSGDAGNADAPSGVALSAVATATAENFAEYHVVAAQLRAWQQWYAEQKELSDK